jgi:hypothetical protein
MRGAWRAVGGLVLVVAGALAADPLAPALLDAGADKVAARVAVPDEARKVGEVRIVTRGRATVVQTLLATKTLTRVIGEIRKKEEANWPPGTGGREDMERYLAALYRAESALLARRDATAGDRTIRLLIEFVATPDTAGLVVGEFTGDEIDGRLAPAERRVMEALPLSKTYAFRNMRLILADSFGLPERDLPTLGPLGPIADAAR